MNKIHKIGLSILIFVTCTGFDRVTKDLAQKELSASRSISLMNDFVRIQYTENTGAMLEFGANLPGEIRFVFFVIIIGIVLLTALAYAIKSPDLGQTQLVGLFLIVAGGSGNYLDRLFNQGAAIDFVSIGIGSLRTGIFNFADIFIIVGASIFILSSIRKDANANQGTQKTR